MKNKILKWLQDHNFKGEFIESSDWELEDDQINIIGTNITIQLDSINCEYFSLTIDNKDDTFTVYPTRFNIKKLFIDLKKALKL